MYTCMCTVYRYTCKRIFLKLLSLFPLIFFIFFFWCYKMGIKKRNNSGYKYAWTFIYFFLFALLVYILVALHFFTRKENGFALTPK